MNIPKEAKLTDVDLLELFAAKAQGPDGDRTDIKQMDRFHWVAEAQLAKAAPIIAAQTRKAERERYNEAVVLIAEVAGLNQSCWQTEDIYALENRAEEILQDLKGEKP